MPFGVYFVTHTRTHGSSLAKLLMYVKYGRLHGPCVVGYGFLQGCAAGIFGRERVCTGWCSTGWARSSSFSFLVLCQIHRCALPGVASACCVVCGTSGFVVSAGALDVDCAVGCWRCFASCRVLCGLFCYCGLLLTVRVVCSHFS